MNLLSESLLELVRRTSTEIPEDVHRAILNSLEREKKGTIAESAMKIIDQNIALARNKSQPICQDTGSIIFYVDCPLGFDQIGFEQTAREAVKLGAKLCVPVRDMPGVGRFCGITSPQGVTFYTIKYKC